MLGAPSQERQHHPNRARAEQWGIGHREARDVTGVARYHRNMTPQPVYDPWGKPGAGVQPSFRPGEDFSFGRQKSTVNHWAGNNPPAPVQQQPPPPQQGAPPLGYRQQQQQPAAAAPLPAGDYVTPQYFKARNVEGTLGGPLNHADVVHASMNQVGHRPDPPPRAP